MTLCALAVASSAFAADQSWTGTVSDKMCGADHKAMGGSQSDKDCTLACTKGGGTPFVLAAGDKTFVLSGHEADLKAQAGKKVVVSGELKGDTIKVSKVEAAK